jgi:hypothetical protein
VRRVDVAHAPAAEVEHLAVGEHARRAIGVVGQVDAAGDVAVRHFGARRGLQPQVERAAFVGLEMAEADPAQALERHDRGHGRTDGGEQLAVSGVEQQRLVAEHEELVEVEPGGRGDLGDVSRDPEDAVGDLVDAGGHGGWSWAIATRVALTEHTCVVK